MVERGQVRRYNRRLVGSAVKARLKTCGLLQICASATTLCRKRAKKGSPQNRDQIPVRVPLRTPTVTAKISNCGFHSKLEKIALEDEPKLRPAEAPPGTIKRLSLPTQAPILTAPLPRTLHTHLKGTLDHSRAALRLR